MTKQVAPKNSFGFCADCPPASDLGFAAYQSGTVFLPLIVVVSLIAGYKLRKSEWVLPLLAMLAAGAIITQAAAYNITFEKQHAYRMIQEYRQGPPVSNPNPENFVRRGEQLIPVLEQDIQEIPSRYKRIFLKGWLAYSVAPFLMGFLFSIFRRRQRPR